MFGHYLMWAAWTAAAVGMNPSQAAGDDASSATQTFKLEPDGHDRLTVAVTIDGQGPFDFMIDTGAQATVLSRELADRLQLNERTPATLIGLVSKVSTETVAVDGLLLGQHNFSIAQAPLVDAIHLGSGVDGILGIDGLQERRVLIDFIRRRIDVADAAALGGNRGYEIIVRARRKLGQLIITDAVVDGVRTAVLVDTGAQSSIINHALAERLRTNSRLTSQLTDVNGVQVEGQLYTLRKFGIDKLTINDIPAFVTASPAFDALGLSEKPAMILGMRELRLFRRVAIDFDTRRILFDVPRSGRAPDAWTG